MIIKILILSLFISGLNANNYKQLSHAVKELIVDMQILQIRINTKDENYSKELDASINSVSKKIEKIKLIAYSDISDLKNETKKNASNIDDFYEVFDKKIKLLNSAISKNNKIIKINATNYNLLKLYPNTNNKLNNRNSLYSNTDIQKAIQLNSKFEKMNNYD